MKKWLAFILVFSISLIAGFALFLTLSSSHVNAAVSITATVTACGTPNEQCSGSDLRGKTCQTQGFDGGTLSCTSLCVFDTSKCLSEGAAPPLAPAAVHFAGLAYPNSAVTILKFGEIIGRVVAEPSGSFQASFSNLTEGTYVFGFVGKDKTGRSSIAVAFPVQLLSGAITSVKNIFLPPTISADKEYVLPGDSLRIEGTAYPAAEITLFVTPLPKTIIPKIRANAKGEWSYVLDARFLDFGSYIIRAQGLFNNLLSPLSHALNFQMVREIPPVELEPLVCQIADLNCDFRVDLVDFSILLFWWDRELVEHPRADINKDGKVDVADLSIMMYYWTG
jgi:hypothetical protein